MELRLKSLNEDERNILKYETLGDYMHYNGKDGYDITIEDSCNKSMKIIGRYNHANCEMDNMLEIRVDSKTEYFNSTPSINGMYYTTFRNTLENRKKEEIEDIKKAQRLLIEVAKITKNYNLSFRDVYSLKF